MEAICATLGAVSDDLILRKEFCRLQSASTWCGLTWYFFVCVCFACPSLLPTSVIKTMTKINWVGRGLFYLTLYSPLLRMLKQELEAGAWRQELKLRLRTMLLSGFAPHSLLLFAGSVCFLIAPRTTGPRMVPLTVGSHQSLNKKMPPQACL